MPFALNWKTIAQQTGYAGTWRAIWEQIYKYTLCDHDHDPNLEENYEDPVITFEGGSPVTSFAGAGIILPTTEGMGGLPDPDRNAMLNLVRFPFAPLELDRSPFTGANIAQAKANVTINGLRQQKTARSYGWQNHGDGTDDAIYDIQIGEQWWGWRKTVTDLTTADVALCLAGIKATGAYEGDLAAYPLAVVGASGQSMAAGVQKCMTITDFVQALADHPEALLFEMFVATPKLASSYLADFDESAIGAIYGANVTANITWVWHENLGGGSTDAWLPVGEYNDETYSWTTIDLSEIRVWIGSYVLPAFSRIPPGWIPPQTPV